MNSKKKNSLKRFIKRIDEAPSPYKFLLWVILVGFYFLWAAVSPMISESHGLEPLMPLTIFAILCVLYYLDRPHRLSFLVILSLTTTFSAPLILVINIYRALAGLFPDAWVQAGFWRGPVIFISIQALGLLLAVSNFFYTVRRWKNADQSEKKELKRQAMLILILMLILLIPVLIFVFAGLIRR